MTYIMDANNLTKSYKGKTALHNVSMNVREGSCFGLLGPNGAGKSTMMKLMAGVLRPDSGTMNLFGMDAQKQRSEIRRRIGYVPQEITLYDKLNARQNLTFLGEMYGVRGKLLHQRITDVLAQVGLADRARDAVGTYSGGMKRRINIAAALLHEPKLIILDEPTVGIDPQSRNHIFSMISELRMSGVTIVYCTHYMEEVEALCDDVAIIDQGSIITQGSLEDLLDKHALKAVYVEADGLDAPPALEGVKAIHREGRGFVLESDSPLQVIEHLSRVMASDGTKVRALELKQPTMGSVFLKLTGTKLRDA